MTEHNGLYEKRKRKGPSIKKVRSQGGLSSADILQTRWRGFFKCGRLHFLAQKTSEFSIFLVCPHGQGGLSQCGQGGGEFFAILCGRLLWTAPNLFLGSADEVKCEYLQKSVLEYEYYIAEISLLHLND